MTDTPPIRRRRVAILGANGQVGAELCLLLSNHPQLELIPICRNQAGSSFLRYSGIPVRHGAPADPAQASGLLGDCDLVVNLALAGGDPRQIRETEQKLIDNAAQFSMRGAQIIYFSTFSVYGDVRPNVRIRFNTAYGRTKLASERDGRKAAARANKELFIFRLGHVTGQLQNITNAIQRHIRAGSVVLADHDPISNTVATATIADAILKIAAGGCTAGVYDLMNNPQWTWRQVFEYESRQIGVPVHLEYMPLPAPPRVLRHAIRHPVRQAMSLVRKVPLAKQFSARIASHLPGNVNRKGYATWSLSRTGNEVAELNRREITEEFFTHIAPAKQFFPGLSETATLLDSKPYRLPPRDPAREFPPDIELAR